MSDEFREDVKAVVRRHDPSADDLRALAADLEELAERYDRQDEIL
jgi:hypothetical protein